MHFQEDFFSKNRRTLFGPLKYRQTLFNVQILLYKDFYDSFRFTQQSPVVNSFPSFAIQMRVANWRPTYLMRCYKDAIAMKIALQNSLKASNSEVKLKRFAKLPTKDMPLFFSIRSG